jgi:hypothetical protein
VYSPKANVTNKWVHPHKFISSTSCTDLYQVHPAQICIKCTRHKFATSTLGTNLQQVPSHKFVTSASRTNFYQVHSAQICNKCLRKICHKCISHKFLSSASRTNFYQVHSTKIWNKCTRHKFATRAPGTNLKTSASRTKLLTDAFGTDFQQMHLAQICNKCIPHKFLSSALGTNLQQVQLAQICNMDSRNKFKNKCILHQILNRFLTDAFGTIFNKCTGHKFTKNILERSRTNIKPAEFCMGPWTRSISTKLERNVL